MTEETKPTETAPAPAPAAQVPSVPKAPKFRDLLQRALKKFPGAEIRYDGAPPATGKVAMPFSKLTSEIQLLVKDTGLCTLDDGQVVLVTDPIRELQEKHPSAQIHMDAPRQAAGVSLADAVRK